MTQSKLDRALLEIHSFIKFLSSRTEGVAENKDKSLHFERGGLGSLHLDYEESSYYNRCLRHLLEASIGDDELSQRSVENSLQESLLKALLTDEDSNGDEFKIDIIIKELKQKLTVKLKKYRCHIPVNGIHEIGLPLTINGLKFTVFDDSLVDEFREAVSRHTVQKEFKWENLQEDINQSFYGEIYSIVTVQAKDYGAAQLRAVDRTRQVLNILNFFSVLVPYNPDAWAYLPGDLNPHNFQTLTLDEEDNASYLLSMTSIGPLQKLEIPRIFKSDEESSIGFKYVLNLLDKSNQTKFDKALITAIQWAGRAVTAKTREESFLLYAIALESIILADNPDSELSYRLSLRIAYVLGSRKENRIEILKIAKRLYGLRSKLVHDGRYEITDLELGSMKSISISCIKRLCIDPIFQQMKSPKDFSDWLDEQILG
jgi:hypothetical protein